MAMDNQVAQTQQSLDDVLASIDPRLANRLKKKIAVRLREIVPVATGEYVPRTFRRYRYMCATCAHETMVVSSIHRSTRREQGNVICHSCSGLSDEGVIKGEVKLVYMKATGDFDIVEPDVVVRIGSNNRVTAKLNADNSDINLPPDVVHFNESIKLHLESLGHKLIVFTF